MFGLPHDEGHGGRQSGSQQSICFTGVAASGESFEEGDLPSASSRGSRNEKKCDRANVQPSLLGSVPRGGAGSFCSMDGESESEVKAGAPRWIYRRTISQSLLLGRISFFHVGAVLLA